MLYLHIKTSQERSGHTIMITDQQRLILIHKMAHTSGRRLTCNRKQKKPKRHKKLNLQQRRNWSIQIEELTERINPTVLVLQSNDRKDKTFREKLESSRKVVSREMMCFKIMKLVYNNYIYTKTFLILK